ncbi:MAG: MerR family transcriptional regulator [Myxococcota bacterium]
MKDEAKYRVGMVAKMTGLSTHTLRVWEKRYAAVLPHRTEAGGRLYNDADVARLRVLSRLVAEGHSIGGIAGLPTVELQGMAAKLPSAEPQGRTDRLELLRRRFIASIEDLDVLGAEQMLSRAALGTEPGEFLRSVVGPILSEVGDRWERGELRIAHEHASSTVMRGLLFSLMRLYPASDAMPVTVVATPAGERHELGALMVAMLATMHGWRVLYLGADLPAEEIGFAAREANAKMIMVSVSNLDGEAVAREFDAIEKAAPPGVRILAGGRAAVANPSSRIEVHDDLDQVERVLNRS